MAKKIDGSIVKPAIMLVQRYMESDSRIAVELEGNAAIVLATKS